MVSKTKVNYPPIKPGTVVFTLGPDFSARKEWTKAGWTARRWSVEGTVLCHSDSHGLCYHVQHADGSEAWYNPTEIRKRRKTSPPDPVKRGQAIRKLLRAGTFVSGTTFAHRTGWYVHPDTKGQQRRMM